MKKTFSRWWPIVALVAVWLLFSYPYVGKGKIPFPSTYLVTFFAPWSATHGMPVKNNAMPDVITQIYPWKRVTMDGWKNGTMPLWNPYSFSGTSHVGNYQSAIFSPVNLLFFVLPETHAWSIMILLQPILAGMFMFMFLRSIGIRMEGSLLGSVSFMFSGFMVVWMAYGTLVYAVLYLPLILYAANRYVTAGSAWAGALIPVSMALSFVSGHFQMSVYVFLFSVTFMAYLAFRTKRIARSLQAFLLLCAGILLAAPQIFPALVSYTNSFRSSLFLKGEVIPWAYLITLFSPDFYGNPVTRNDWFGHYAEWAGYIGVIPLSLAVYAFVRNKAGWTGYFAGLTALVLLLAYQTPLSDLLFALRIPVLSTSAASRIIILASFSMAVLAGIGCDQLLDSWKKKPGRSGFVWFALCGLFTGLLWLTLLIIRPMEAGALGIAARNSVLPTAMVVLSVGIAAAGFMVPIRFRGILVLTLVGATAFEMYRFSSKWMPFDEPSYIYPEVPVLTTIKSLTKGNTARVFGNIGNEAGSAFGIQLPEGYDAVYQYRYGRFISSVSTGKIGTVDRSVVKFDKTGRLAEDMLQLLGIRYYLHKKSDGRFPWAYPFWEYPHYRRVWEDNDFEIHENTKSLPRAFLASSYVLARGDQEILDTLFSPDTDRRKAVVLEKTPDLVPQEGYGEATITAYDLTDVRIMTEADTPKLLFLSDVFDSGWKASVDGKQTEVFRADFDFRSVEVPAGVHEVRFWYEPDSVRYGLYASAFATLGIAGFLLWKRSA